MNAEIAAALRDIMRVGEVVSTDPETCTARVKFYDADDMVSAPLHVAQRKTLEDKDYWMPDIGEMVVCAFLGNGAVAGFVMFAIYNAVDTPPIVGQDVHYKKYKDETTLMYDREKHLLDADVKGDIDVNADGNDDCDGKIRIIAKDAIALLSKTFYICAEDVVSIDGTEIDINMDGKANITAPVVDINASDKCNINCPAVNLGNGASQGVVHAASPCPIYGVFHLNPSQTTKTAL